VQALDVIDLDADGKHAAEAYLPRFGLLLDDLSCISEDQLLNRKLTPSARVALLVLKTAPGNPQITALLRRWEDRLRAVLDQPGGGEAFLAILTYIFGM
jgi:hypothetical protein